jgi:hypothetical protein
MVMSEPARERLAASRRQEVATLLTPDIYSWYRQQLEVYRMRFELVCILFQSLSGAASIHALSALVVAE